MASAPTTCLVLQASTLPDKREPMLHQNDCLDWALPRPRVPILMEMRLGKTLVASRWAQAKRPDNVLVVGPLSTLSSWQDELSLEGVSAHLLQGKAIRRLATSRAYSGWFLINYEGLRCSPEIADEEWDVVILDESTRISNPRAQITKICVNRFKHVPYRAILSGLPNPESLLNYYCQMAFLYDGVWLERSNYYSYRRVFFQNKTNKWKWKPKPGTRAIINDVLEEEAFRLTRKQAGIGSKKIYEKRIVPMSDQQKTAQRLAVEYMEAEQDGKRVETKWVLTRLLWLCRIAGGFHPLGTMIGNAKAKELLSLLVGELENEPVLVWFRFRWEMAYIEELLRKKKIAVEAIHGDVKPEKRHAIRKRLFSGETRVVLLQVNVGKYGIDLSVASTAIYYSNSYSGEARAQSEDRMIHPKKKDPLLYIDLISKGSVDSKVVETVRQKVNLSKLMMTELLRCLGSNYSR